MTRGMGSLRGLRWSSLKDLGPYALVELLVPGGSVLAALMWLYWRHKKAAAARDGGSRQMSIPNVEVRI